MKLVVFSHKPCWPSTASPSGYATDGGFPLQMGALSQLFDTTTLLVPCCRVKDTAGEMPLCGHHLTIRPLTDPRGSGPARKARMVAWLVRNGPAVLRETVRADAVHAAIPGDVGTVGMLLAWLLKKPLLVRTAGTGCVRGPGRSVSGSGSWSGSRAAGT
jgi:hypothetical protein